MSASIEQAAEQMVRLRHNNLQFFQKHFPAIYEFYKDKKLGRFKVNVLPEKHETDLWVDGKSLYGERAKAYAKEEVEKFLSVFSPGKQVDSLSPPPPGSYAHPRFVHRKLDNILRVSPLDTNQVRTYTVPKFFPLICFLGVGLGYHIEEMVKHHNVENLVVFEQDPDAFNATLYTVDWGRICEPYVGKPDRFIHFVITGVEDREMNWAAVWNVLICQCPVFPVMTLFYNHLGAPLANYIADRVNEDMYVFLSSWGHFDDELRQLNNALHALHQGVQWIPPKDSFAGNDLPVVILGSGPSLASRIEALKQHQGKCLIISAGTAIKVLEKHGLRPDFHVEIESDSVNVRALRQVDPEFLKEVNLIAASQVAPSMWQLFANGRLFFKHENAIGGYFGRPEFTIADGTPTCTNAAVVVALHLGFRRLVFLGMDFGYRDKEHHHVPGTVYDETDSGFKYRPNDEFEVEAVKGGKVLTQPIYFSAKRKIEVVLADQRRAGLKIQAHNSSDGARINGADWMSDTEFDQWLKLLPDASAAKAEFSKMTFIEPGKSLAPERLALDTERLVQRVQNICDAVKDMIRNARLNGKRDVQRLNVKITRALEGLKNTDEPTYYFIRGAIRHIQYTGYSHVMALPEDQSGELTAFIGEWRARALDILKTMPEHLRRIACKPEFDLGSDPWVEQSIHDEEAGIDTRLSLKFTLGNIFFSDIIKE